MKFASSFLPLLYTFAALIQIADGVVKETLGISPAASDTPKTKEAAASQRAACESLQNQGLVCTHLATA
jgi:hypothetical protein